jgi:ATP-dependent RNA helicase HrpB
MTAPLPIDPLLPEIVRSLGRTPALVVVAPPGAGKTTRVPPALLDGGMAPTGEILVSEPRRVAARAAARRLAFERGVRVGDEVGYRVRLDTRAGDRTRITFVTEGILTRRLQRDPLLEGVDVVVLDEFHERSLEADLALALVAEVQRDLRPDLRLVAMSATLEAAPLAAYLGDCPVLEAQGRSHPVQVRFDPRPDDRPLAVRAAGGVARALADPDDDGGHVLVFLPGAAEIRRTEQLLAGGVDGAGVDGRRRLGVRVLPLHGDMDAAAQDAALDPAGSERKIILATNVAETSLTIDGVTTVVDGGLVKQLRHDPRWGLDRLVLAPISRASATQRAGRAGRTAPGRVFRLWTREDHHGRAERDLPEVRRVELASVALQVRAWGCADPADFPWFESPPEAALERADRLLRSLGAVDRTGITPLGRQMLAMPLHPRLARMLVAAHGAGCLEPGALLAALASERDVVSAARAFGGGTRRPAESVGVSDLLWRLDLLTEARRAGGSAALRGFGLDPGATRRVRSVARQLEGVARSALGKAESVESESSGKSSEGRSKKPSAERLERELLKVLLLGYPDRVGVRRTEGGSRLLLAGGREGELHESSVVKEGTLLVAHRVEDAARGRAARVRLASQITPGILAEALPGTLSEETVLVFDEAAGRVVARRQRRFGDLIIDQKTVGVGDRSAAGELLARAAARDPRRGLGWSPAVDQWLARVRFALHNLPEAGFPVFDEATLSGLAADLCAGLLSFDELRRVDLLAALGARLTRAQSMLLDREVPERLTVPSGSRIQLDYPAGPPVNPAEQSLAEPPVLAVRIQELFGLEQTPRVARGRVAVLLHLLAPSRRPVQVTRDLESFWDRGYHDVRRELQGRYPKHAWPQDPRTAQPTHRARRRRPK